MKTIRFTIFFFSLFFFNSILKNNIINRKIFDKLLPYYNENWHFYYDQMRVQTLQKK